MPQVNRIAKQRKLVVEQLHANSDEVIFELLSDILSIEREHIDNKHGVKEKIKRAIDVVAEHDLPDNYC